jgi:hypothetical protein
MGIRFTLTTPKDGSALCSDKPSFCGTDLRAILVIGLESKSKVARYYLNRIETDNYYVDVAETVVMLKEMQFAHNVLRESLLKKGFSQEEISNMIAKVRTI